MSALDQAASATGKLLTVAVAVLAVAWLASGIRTIGPGDRAVLLRFGAPVQVAQSGLLLAWPRPLDEVVVVPGVDRLHDLEITSLDWSGRGRSADESAPAGDALDPRSDGGYALSGEAGIVHLRATVRWTVAEPVLWVRAGASAEASAPAITMAVRAALTAAAARRPLDALVVFGGEAAAGAARERLREEIAQDARRRLLACGAGVSIARIDLAVHLPEHARPAFEQVATAGQQAERDIAEARTAAERLRQQAGQESAAIRARSEATARELLTRARVDTAAITALAAEPGARRGVLLQRLWRDRIDQVFARIAGITAIAPDGGTVILPGWSR